VELIILVVTLSIVGVLAMRFGYDSRAPAQSKEQDVANLGMSWEDQADTTACDVPREAALFRFGPSRKSARPRLEVPQILTRMLRELVGRAGQ